MMDPTASAKTYWSILKRLLNDKKIPCIPPLFHDNKFITDFKEKAEFSNSDIVSDIAFNSKDTSKVISDLDPNKAHGHDMISIRM